MLLKLLFLALFSYLSAEDICNDSPGCANARNSFLGRYAKGAVATHSVYCSEIGRNTLLKGGNAVDAAIASMFCIGVLDGLHAGLGGGHFMTIYNATTKKCTAINAREVAPAAANETMFVGEPYKSLKGWLAIAVPGELHGFWTAYKRFGGKVPWSQLVKPTIDLLEMGYPTSYIMALALKGEEKNMGNGTLLKQFTNPKTGKVYEEGDQIVTRQVFTKTLKAIAKARDPVKLFYNGSLTLKFVKEFKKHGGILKLSDFNSYHARVYENDEVIYTKLNNGRYICGPPPPSGSAAAQMIINVLDDYFVKNAGTLTEASFLHRYIEASKFAYAARSKLSDSDFNHDAMKLAREVTSEEYAAKLENLITDGTHSESYYGAEFDEVDDHGTSHASIIDYEGNAVSITSTINLLFGASVASESTGVIWNDNMNDFSTPKALNSFGLKPSQCNFVQPGKRPMSSMSPLVIFNVNDPMEVFAIGGTGGSRIIGAVSYVALRSLHLGEDLQEAIFAPRLHNQLQPNITFYDPGLPEEQLEDLKSRGHALVEWDNDYHPRSSISAVKRVSHGTVFGMTEYRLGSQSAPAGW